MKVYAITGATGGMGISLCHRLAKSGYALALCSTNEGLLESLSQELTERYGISVHYAAFDICDEAAAEEFYVQAEEKFGKLDGLINLAGLSIPTKMESVTPEDFDKMYNVNVKGALLAAKHYALHAVEQGGLIINLGSMAGRRANANAPLYCTSKSALNMLSSAMQLQLAGKDIRITTLNPGGVDTRFWGERKVDRSKLMSADDVVDAIEFVVEHPRMVIYSMDFEAAVRVPDLK